MHMRLMVHWCFARFATAAADTKFLRHLDGLLLLGLTLSGLVRTKHSPRSKEEGQFFRGKGGGIIAFLCSMACTSVSTHVHLINSVSLQISKVLFLFQSPYDITV